MITNDTAAGEKIDIQRNGALSLRTLVVRWIARVHPAVLIVFLLALMPRVLAQGRFVTVDEIYHWFDRSRLFLQAIRSGDYAGTILVGHPGVTTMWLGAGGVATHELLVTWGWAVKNDPDLHRVLLRLPVAIVTSLCIALAYPLLRRLFDRRMALLAVLLWAADPFLVAHAQLLHLDALLASFMNLALLAALAAFYQSDQDAIAHKLNWCLLCASAIAGGLALLTKSPSILLLPLISLIGIISSLSLIRSDDTQTRVSRLRSITSRWFLPPLAWVAVALTVWFALWPATWVNLPMVIDRIIHQASSDGGSPHGWGNFFLGQAVADPGLLFYPVALVLRMTPWTLGGVLAVAGAA